MLTILIQIMNGEIRNIYRQTCVIGASDTGSDVVHRVQELLLGWPRKYGIEAEKNISVSY